MECTRTGATLAVFFTPPLHPPLSFPFSSSFSFFLVSFCSIPLAHVSLTCVHFYDATSELERAVKKLSKRERERERERGRCIWVGDAQNRIYPRKRTASRRMAREKARGSNEWTERANGFRVGFGFGSVVPRINQLCLSVFHRAGGELISFSLNTNFFFFEAKTYFD